MEWFETPGVGTGATRPKAAVAFALALGAVAGGCGGTASETTTSGPGAPGVGSDAAVSPSDGGTGPGATTESPDGGPNLDAFWAEDPPPQMCFADGRRVPPPGPPGGTPECPDDKNREGCPCEVPGETALCWPGLRANRGLGICQDGTTTCRDIAEFDRRWGPCEGYVLPDVGATSGPGACRCFSEGTWAIDNLSPCLVTYGSSETYAVSTFVNGDGVASCPTSVRPNPPPNPEPGQPWSPNRLTVDCSGQFELCLTIKAGDDQDPQPSDCVLGRSCVEAWVETPGEPQELPPLPSWVSTDTACVSRYQRVGGYGELSVLGTSRACDVVDDGSGGEYVFQRYRYCPDVCRMTPDAPECVRCEMGGSGSF